MSEPGNKQDPLTFEDGQLSELYRRVSTQTPSGQIDEAVVAASRRAVKSRPQSTGPFSGRWHVPVALAATLVLAIVIVPDLYNESSKHAELPVSGERASDSIGRAIEQVEPAASVPGTAPVIPESATLRLREMETRQESQKSEYEETVKTRRRQVKMPSTPMEPKHSEMPDSDFLEKDLRIQPAAPAMLAPTMAPQSTPRAQSRRSAEDDPELVEAWLVEIRRLSVAGQTDEAKRQLGLFVKVYPEYLLPQDLASLKTE